MKKIFIINGPNLNLLGKREENIYGSETLEDINKKISQKAEELKLEVAFFQSNSEGEIVSKIQELKKEGFSGLIINPGAYTHTSIAIRDAIAGVNINTIEVHISNIHSREEFRKQSFIAPVCIGQISGLSYFGYIYALEYFAN